MKNWRWLVPLFIFIASFSVRFVYLNQLESMPTFNYPIMDEKYHVEIAGKINSDEGYGDEPFYRAPLYPYFFSGLYQLTGKSLFWTRFIQIILGALLPLLIYLFGLKLFNNKVAFWATAVAVFYPTFLYYDSSLLITSLMVLLTAILVWQLYRCQENPRPFNFILAGLLLGLAGLARPNILILGPALFIWIWFVIKPRLGFKKAFIRYILIGIVSIIIILPVTARNYFVGKDLVFIAWQGGFNFFLGNNRLASGWSATVPGIDFTWEGGYREAIAIAEQNSGRELKRSEVSDYWYGMAFDEIKKSPGRYALLIFKKLLLFFNGYEIPNNQDLYFTREYVPLLIPLMFTRFIYFPFGLLAPLAIIGLFYSFKEWRKYLIFYLVIGSYLITLLLFFVCTRFRQPLLPYLILFAIAGIYGMVKQFRSSQKINSILISAGFIMLLIGCNYNILKLDAQNIKAENHLNMGLAYLEQNRLSRADKQFQISIKTDPSFAPAHSNLGIIATRRGKLVDATKHFRAALENEPYISDHYFNLSNNFADRGDIVSAVKVLEDARQVFPNHPKVLLRLSATYLQAGQLDSAQATIDECLQYIPNNDLARQIRNEIIRLKE